MTAGVELARRYPSALLVFTGGPGGLLGEGPAEAIGARKLWLSLGVPEERMMFEAKSRNTWENALFTRVLVKPKPGETWLLVTSAWHMPRSIGIFRHLGFDVIPYPVAYRTFGDERDFLLAHLECSTKLLCSITASVNGSGFWPTGWPVRRTRCFPRVERRSGRFSKA